MRLNKFLAERIGISRREADDLIASGRVTVDGKNAEFGMQIDDNTEVLVDKKNVAFSHNYTYLMLNKPRGYVSSRRRQGDMPTLYELLPKNLQTLKIKTYIVELDKPLAPLHQQMISDIGITLPDGLSKLFITKLADKNGEISGKRLQVEMSEGRNRQIRRTFAALGYEVTDLDRIEFGHYKLGELERGKFEKVQKLI